MDNLTQLPNRQSNITIENWREFFLQRILILSSIIGLFALIPAVISTEVLGLQGVYIGAYVLIVTSVIIRFPYLIKASLFVLLPLFLGVGSLTETGIRGDSLFFFLAFVSFGTLFINQRVGVAAIFVSEMIIIVIGYMALNGLFTFSDKTALGGEITDWLSAAISHLLFSLVIIIGIKMLKQVVRQNQQHADALSEALNETHMQIENQVADRTKELTEKTKQINAATFITHQIAAVQDLDKLLRKTVNLVAEQFDLYHVGIFLLNQRGDFVNLQAASSEGGIRLVERGYRLRVGTEGITGFVAAERKPHIAMDVGQDTVFFDSPELPETRSELSLPLIVHNKLVGVLDLQSAEVDAFIYEDLDIYQTMADQIAVTIENARLLTESQLVISQLETISNENTRQNWRTELLTQKPAYHYSITGIRSADKAALKLGGNTLNIPIALRGQKIGMITLQRKAQFHNWTAQEQAVASKVADQTALALENIRLVERTRQRASREQAFAKVTARVRETLDLDTVLRTTAREIQKALDLQEVEVRLIPQEDPDGKQFTEQEKP